jgi:hypothetical protein
LEKENRGELKVGDEGVIYSGGGHCCSRVSVRSDKAWGTTHWDGVFGTLPPMGFILYVSLFEEQLATELGEIVISGAGFYIQNVSQY